MTVKKLNGEEMYKQICEKNANWIDHLTTLLKVETEWKNRLYDENQQLEQQ